MTYLPKFFGDQNSKELYIKRTREKLKYAEALAAKSEQRYHEDLEDVKSIKHEIAHLEEVPVAEES